MEMFPVEKNGCLYRATSPDEEDGYCEGYPYTAATKLTGDDWTCTACPDDESYYKCSENIKS